MNKQQLMTLLMSLVERVQEHDEGLSEGEARTLVGISLRHHSDSIVAKCMGIVEPDWSDYRSEAKTVADLEDEAAAHPLA